MIITVHDHDTFSYHGHKGVTRDVSFAYLAEGEPKLQDIRDRFESGALIESALMIELAHLVGMPRFTADYERVTKDVPGSLSKVEAFDEWSIENPKVRRVYADGLSEALPEFIIQSKSAPAAPASEDF